jgi:SMODS-associated and fused to various effectors sensor domain
MPKTKKQPSSATAPAPAATVTRKVERAYISSTVRRDLWVAAAGRCEFRGCCKAVNRDFLTKAKCKVGEYAHIIADSPAGARGVSGLSEQLAADPNNLMLACFDCHSRIDRHGQKNEFTVQQLSAMKREHEARIERVYSATGVVESMPVIMSFPISTHVPIIDVRNIHYAMLTNSDFSRFPTSTWVHIDQSSFHLQDNDPDFWSIAQRALTQQYEQRIRPELIARGGAAHLTIAGFAPIPMLMKLGALVGDKTPANIMDLPGENWLWDARDTCPEPSYIFIVPSTLPREVSVVVSISGRAQYPEGRAIVEFQAVVPGRGIIRKESHVQQFRTSFNAFLQQLFKSGARVLHIYPATPLSASIEIGRSLLPKAFEEVHVWDWQAPDWKSTLRLK